MEQFSTAIDFGTFSLPWNAVFLVLAVLAAVITMSALVRQRKLYRDLALDLCILCIPVGMIGARVFAALSGKIEWASFFSLADTGLNLFGAILFCTCGIYCYCRIRKFDFGQTMDLAAPGALFAIAIGRWQDFFLCDGIGYPVQKTALKFFPLATFTRQYFTDGVSVAYAVFFWEFLICVGLGLFALLFLLRRELQHGDAAALSMLLYGVCAFFLECARDPAYRQIVFSDVTFNELMAALLVLGVFLWLLLAKRFRGIRIGLRQKRLLTDPEEPAAEQTPAEDAQTEDSVHPDKRILNPHIYLVDLSDPLYDRKKSILAHRKSAPVL